MAVTTFNLSPAEETWVNARPDERKRVSAGTGDLLIDRKPFENGTTVVIENPVTITGPGKLTVQDTDDQVKRSKKPAAKKQTKKES